MIKVKVMIVCLLLVVTNLTLSNDKESLQESLEKKIALFEVVTQQFESLCVGHNGEILEGTVVLDQESAISDGPVLSCHDEAIRLAKMLSELQGEVRQLEDAELYNSSKCTEKPNVSALPFEIEENKSLMRVSEINENFQEQICKEQSGVKCIEDIGCNLTRTLIGPASKLLAVIPEKFRKNVPECISPNGTDCVTEFINGVIQDIWSNLTGLWSLAKMGASASKDFAVKSWKSLMGIEDKTSDAALAASTQEDSAIDKFKNDPVTFFKELGVGIWEMMGKSIKENFGCERWDGIPHFSNCVRPMSNWECSTCSQKMNAVCGVAGILGGEVVVAWLSGGVFAIAGKGVEKSAAMFGKVGVAIKNAVPAVEKLGVVTIPFVKTFEYAQKVLNSSLCVKLSEYARKAAQSTVNAALKISQTKAVTITMKMVKGGVSPVTHYIQLLNSSFNAGMSATNKLFAKNSMKLQKVSEMMQTREHLGDVDNIILNTKDIDAISPDVVKIKLKEQGVPYDEVKLQDGTDGIKVKIDPKCSTHGGHSLLIKK